jgi:hypothetical protein
MCMASPNVGFASDLASLSMIVSVIRYMTAPSNVKTTVLDSLVGCGISSDTIAITPDAREYLKTLFQGKLIRARMD